MRCVRNGKANILVLMWRKRKVRKNIISTLTRSERSEKPYLLTVVSAGNGTKTTQIAWATPSDTDWDRNMNMCAVIKQVNGTIHQDVWRLTHNEDMKRTTFILSIETERAPHRQPFGCMELSTRNATHTRHMQPILKITFAVLHTHAIGENRLDLRRPS